MACMKKHPDNDLVQYYNCSILVVIAESSVLPGWMGESERGVWSSPGLRAHLHGL